MQDYTEWQGKTLVDSEGKKVGEVGDIYTDESTGEPTWATVHTGFFGTKYSFFPLSKVEVREDELVINTTADMVKNAPHMEADGKLEKSEERALYEYYDQEWGDDDDDIIDEQDDDAPVGAVGHDTSGPTTDNAMTRSEEELQVGTQQQEKERVRLKKYIVTDHVQTTVPVEREEVRIEREAITDDNRDAAMDGPELSEEEHEVILTEEVPVVDKKVVPKERVRLDKEKVQDTERVESDVRKEAIDIEGDGGKRSDG